MKQLSLKLRLGKRPRRISRSLAEQTLDRRVDMITIGLIWCGIDHGTRGLKKEGGF